jgi:hypothetical protein
MTSCSDEIGKAIRKRSQCQHSTPQKRAETLCFVFFAVFDAQEGFGQGGDWRFCEIHGATVQTGSKG